MIWMCTNLTRSQGKTFEAVRIELRKLIYPCCYMLKQTANETATGKYKSTICDLTWITSFASEDSASSGARQMIIDSGALRTIVDLLYCPSLNNSAKAALVRTLGNFCAGSDAETQLVINNGAITALYSMLKNNHIAVLSSKIRKEIIWIFSNMAAGLPCQIDSLLAAVDGNVFQHIVSLSLNAEERVRKEALYTITSTINGLAAKKIEKLLCSSRARSLGAGTSFDGDAGTPSLVKSLVLALQSSDVEIILLGLDGIRCLLTHGDVFADENHRYNYENPVTAILEEADALDLIETLQQHANEKIYQQAFKIIDKWFNESNEDLDPPSP